MDNLWHKKRSSDSSSLNMNGNDGIQERMISCGILIDRIWDGDGRLV